MTLAVCDIAQKWFGVIVRQALLDDITDTCLFCFSEQVFALFLGETVVALVPSLLAHRISSSSGSLCRDGNSAMGACACWSVDLKEYGLLWSLAGCV